MVTVVAIVLLIGVAVVVQPYGSWRLGLFRARRRIEVEGVPRDPDAEIGSVLADHGRWVERRTDAFEREIARISDDGSLTLHARIAALKRAEERFGDDLASFAEQMRLQVSAIRR